MNLSLLRTFVAVYRAGSVSGAAPGLGLSQPAVTAQVRSLEAQLGRQLFERGPRGVVPTAAAHELAREVAGHIDALGAVCERLTGRDAFSAPVHLAGPAELVAEFAMPALAPAVARGLALRVTLGLADELLAGLPSGRFDVVISTVRPRTASVSAVALLDEEFVLVAAAPWVERIGPAVREPAALHTALREVPLIGYAEDLPIVRRYWRTVFGARARGSAAVVVPDLRSVLAAVQAGAGVSVLPRYLCRGPLASGALVALLEPELPPINTIFLATRSGSAALPHIALVQGELMAAAARW